MGMGFQGDKGRTLALSVLATLVMGLMILLVFNVSIPNPNMILIVVLVLFTGIGGWIPGGISALLILAYSMFFFSTDHSLFSYTDQNAQKMMVILVGDLCCYAVVGMLKHSRDRDHRNLLETNRTLSEMNRRLEEKAHDDARIAELSESVTSLLTNMPALTFSKDISTGRYLACNQLFAEYAHKPSPDGVVGLTDHEIFDKETADHFVEDDKIALSMDEPYIFFEDVPDAVGNPRHFQTTKQKFYDQQGRLCTLGMCVDVTELVNMKRETREIRKAFERSRFENFVISHIARSLSSDYTYVYYVNIDTDEYVEYRAADKGTQLSLVLQSRDFFAQTEADAQSAIYEEDREEFLSLFTKENIVRALGRREAFTLSYRLVVEGVPTYVSLKATGTKDDPKHVVIGVMNVDAQVKERENAKRIREERATYNRLHALSGDYIAMYSVNPDTCRYRQYSANALYDELGIALEGEDFFATARKNAQRVVYHADLEKFTYLFNRANVLGEIHANGIFALRYRLMLDGSPVHVRLKAAMVDEKGSRRLIVGVINISEQVKQDEEYEYRIAVARTLANCDELTGVKNKHAYAELERELNQQIEGREPVEFAIAVFDVNELKNVNDTHGHQAGDEHLKRACSLICNVFDHSPVFRVGGDEFAVISRGSDYRDIESLMAQVEHGVRDGASGGVTVAGGMARYHGQPNVAAVFEEADKLMYENKRAMKLGLSRDDAAPDSAEA